jgi:hypothetical protein
MREKDLSVNQAPSFVNGEMLSGSHSIALQQIGLATHSLIKNIRKLQDCIYTHGIMNSSCG